MLGPVGEGLSSILVDRMMGRISDKEGMDMLSLSDEEYESLLSDALSLEMDTSKGRGSNPGVLQSA